MARKRSKAPIDALNDNIDRTFAREDFGGTLRAGQLASTSARATAQLAYDWLKAAERSNDLGGRRGLGQSCIADVLEAARCVLELGDPDPDVNAAFEASIEEFLTKHAKPRPLSIVAAAAVLVAWRTPPICKLFAGASNVYLGFRDQRTSCPWLQILPAFLHDDVRNAIQGSVQFEPVAETWEESRTLASALTKCLPISDHRGTATIAMAQSFDTVEDTFSHWKLCRSIITVDVRVET